MQNVTLSDLQIQIMKDYTEELRKYEEFFDNNDKQSNDELISKMKILKDKLELITLGLHYRDVLNQMGLNSVYVPPTSNLILR